MVVKRRTAAAIAWPIGLASIAMIVGTIVLMFIDRHAAIPSGGNSSSAVWNFSNVLNDVVNAAVPVLGIVLATRRPGNPIGWLFLAAGFMIGLSSFGTSYSIHALVVDPGSLPAGNLLAWFSNWTAFAPLAALAFLFLLFPNGHLPSRRWRPVAWFVAGVFSLDTLFFLLFSTMTWSNPYGRSSNNSPGLFWFIIIILPLFCAIAGSVAAVVVRFRGSTGEERLQLKWFATGAVAVGCTLIASFGSQVTPPLVQVLQSLAFVFLYIAIGIAVLKYRLYEIDVVINKTVVYGVLAAFFTAVYVAVVVGIGSAIGSTRSPFLTLIAAAVIALAFNPVRQRAKRLADRIVYGKRATPYEVLSRFSEQMADAYALDDILPTMAKVLAEGTGGRSEIWLRVGGALRTVATWPNGTQAGPPFELSLNGEGLPEFPKASKATPVLHQGDVYGAITVTKPPSEPLRPAEDKLIEDVASQAGLVLRNVRLIEELRASRQRMVKAQDEARRRLERNIHDGAQQQLVSLAVKLNLAESLVRKDPQQAEDMLGELKVETQEALQDLRDLARGIYPPLLADKGLAAALDSQARKSSVPVSVVSDGIGRFPQEVEAAVYFCCLEAMQNVAKYAEATSVTIRLQTADGMLTFEVSDDGAGFDTARTGYGTGLQGMADRLDALGGSLSVKSESHHGTTVAGSVPAEGANVT
jgi:signal transduction histidine kinase